MLCGRPPIDRILTTGTSEVQTLAGRAKANLGCILTMASSLKVFAFEKSSGVSKQLTLRWTQVTPKVSLS
jgi:hypothetical protein